LQKQDLYRAKELVLILSGKAWKLHACNGKTYALIHHLLQSIHTSAPLITYTSIHALNKHNLIVLYLFYAMKAHWCYALSWNIPLDLLIWCCSKQPKLKNPVGIWFHELFKFLDRMHLLQLELLRESKGRVTLKYIKSWILSWDNRLYTSWILMSN
jgi:hypothetical protein